MQRELPFWSWVFRGAVDHGRVYETYHVGRGDESEPALVGTALRNPEAPLDTILLPAVRQPPLEIEPVITRDRLHVVMQDDLGVNRIRVFRIEPDPERLETTDD